MKKIKKMERCWNKEHEKITKDNNKTIKGDKRKVG